MPKSSVDPKLGTVLTQVYETYINSVGEDSGPSAPAQTEYISVDIAFTDSVDNESAKEALSSAAVEVDVINCFARVCSVRIPVSTLKDISNVDSVVKLKAVQASTEVGSFTSEGDAAMFTNIARSKYSVNGSGLLIGVMSDSYNCLNGASNDILSGDLPSGDNSIVVVIDLSSTECDDFGAVDEGRAMMQLIYDVAPGARLAFRTAYRGEADFAAGILELAAAGCDVIVDDIFYFSEPMFQDGVVAQAVDQVVAQGITYFSSAGNRGRNSWIAPAGFVPVYIGNNTFHQFGTDSNGSPITSMRIVMQGNSRLRTHVFQWDELFASVSGAPGSRSDIDLFLRFGSNIILSNDKNTGSDPLEGFQFKPSDFSSNTTVTAELSIQLVSGPPPAYMKILVFGEVTSFEFPMASASTNFGHQNAALGASVGAAFYGNTPAFGVSPPVIERFSSAGGTPVLFSKNGTRLSSPDIRNRPRFVGPDGGANTFFGDGATGVFRFFGTSAAAPHAAAVAALMLQFKGGKRSLTPDKVYDTLASTAIDMDDPFTVGFDVGFDFGTGAGFLNATAALAALVVPTRTKTCGLFGKSIFCPFTFCGVFGRLVGLCRN
jgi:Subtilase family